MAGKMAAHLNDRKAKNWISSAIKHPGSFTKSAKKAGESVSEYEQDKKGAAGVLGKRARLALTLSKLRKK